LPSELRTDDRSLDRLFVCGSFLQLLGTVRVSLTVDAVSRCGITAVVRTCEDDTVSSWLQLLQQAIQQLRLAALADLFSRGTSLVSQSAVMRSGWLQFLRSHEHVERLHWRLLHESLLLSLFFFLCFTFFIFLTDIQVPCHYVTLLGS
jgi:hypothetical protein